MLDVVCLCAEWCSACRAWRPDWDAAAARHPQHRWQWLDIEDEPDLMDEVGLDIETFPTMLIARGGQALFLSAIPPQPAFLDHLLARLGASDAAPQGVAPEAVALAQRLAARHRA
ncbi:thioredoxin family protein [Hydrogenophaga flava]|uniref:thioredoxin family protein n=1 Tax=Hydrogenophaga flava TaxID=65657 RepID=UPI000A6B8147|nr:thioredoxin family protein [Hydrogenophaga flava]